MIEFGESFLECEIFRQSRRENINTSSVQYSPHPLETRAQCVDYCGKVW